MTETVHRRKCYHFDGDKMKVRTDYTKPRIGGNGFGLSEEEVSYTITVRDRHMVALIGERAICR